MAFSPGGGLLATANTGDSTVSVFSVGVGRRADPGHGLAVRDRRRPVLGGVQSGWGAARDRQLRRQHGVGVLGRLGRRADARSRAPRSPPARDPVSVAFSPGGGLLATANASDSTVSVFSVGSGGALTPVTGSPFATGSDPHVGGVQPGWGAARDRQLRRQHGVGVLGRLGRRADPGHGLAVRDRQRSPVSVAFSPGGGLLATANDGDNSVSVFSVGSGGALTQVTGSPFATGNQPGLGGVQPGWGAARDRQRRRRQRCRCSRSLPRPRRSTRRSTGRRTRSGSRWRRPSRVRMARPVRGSRRAWTRTGSGSPGALDTSTAGGAHATR